LGDLLNHSIRGGKKQAFTVDFCNRLVTEIYEDHAFLVKSRAAVFRHDGQGGGGGRAEEDKT
jgi:hypothetical protein